MLIFLIEICIGKLYNMVRKKLYIEIFIEYKLKFMYNEMCFGEYKYKIL